VACQKPLVLMDGAHNPHGARALKEYIENHHGSGRKILVFGVMKDKDYRAMLDEILPLFDTVILTKPAVERALSPDDLRGSVRGALVREKVEDALREARSIARDEDLIVITGSIFTIGEAKPIIDAIF
jgi:dihydrofolate synthase / folylpolyglutamate synthase